MVCHAYYESYYESQPGNEWQTTVPIAHTGKQLNYPRHFQLFLVGCGWRRSSCVCGPACSAASLTTPEPEPHRLNCPNSPPRALEKEVDILSSQQHQAKFLTPRPSTLLPPPHSSIPLPPPHSSTPPLSQFACRSTTPSWTASRATRQRCRRAHTPCSPAPFAWRTSRRTTHRRALMHRSQLRR